MQKLSCSQLRTCWRIQHQHFWRHLGDFKQPDWDDAGHEFLQQVSTNPTAKAPYARPDQGAGPCNHRGAKIPRRTFQPQGLSLRGGKELDQVTQVLRELLTTSWHKGHTKGWKWPSKIKVNDPWQPHQIHVSKNQVYQHINEGPELGCSASNLYPNTAPKAIHTGSLATEDLLDFSMCNIHNHWKTWRCKARFD